MNEIDFTPGRWMKMTSYHGRGRSMFKYSFETPILNYFFKQVNMPLYLKLDIQDARKKMGLK
jgi:hypothetical protein